MTTAPCGPATIGLADSQRRLAGQPPAAQPTCAATTTTTRSTWSSSAPAPAARAHPTAGPCGWRVVVPGRRPVLGPRHRLGLRRTRLARAVLDRAAPDRRRRPGSVGLQQLRARGGRIDGALRRLHAAFSPVGLPHAHRTTASARTGRSTTATSNRTTSRSKQELPVAGQDWPWGDPHPYPHHPHPVGGNGEIFLRGAKAAGIDARVGPVAIPNGRFGNRPHCIYRGFCLQGCKVNAKASPLITHIPDALAHGAEIRPDCHGRPGRRRRPHRRAPPASTTCRAGASTTSGPAPSRSPATPSKRRGCCCSRPPSATPTGWATTTTSSAAT